MTLHRFQLRALFWLAVALPCFLLAGCLPEFEQAVADKEHFTLDQRLVGDWSDDTEKFAVRLREKETGIYEMVYLEADSIPFRALKVGELHLICLSARSVTSESEEKKPVDLDSEKLTVSALYEVAADGSLHLFNWDMTKLAKALDSGSLQGKVERSKRGKIRKIVISSSADEVRTWLKANGRAAFEAKPSIDYARR